MRCDIYAEKQSGLVDLEACEEPAADLAAYGIEDEIVGVLEIPAMELTIPVYGLPALRRYARESARPDNVRRDDYGTA